MATQGKLCPHCKFHGLMIDESFKECEVCGYHEDAKGRKTYAKTIVHILVNPDELEVVPDQMPQRGYLARPWLKAQEATGIKFELAVIVAHTGKIEWLRGNKRPHRPEHQRGLPGRTG